MIVRLLLALVLLVLACGFAGCYGAIHNQISYTVAPEYFTKFKFPQFGIQPSMPDRMGAAVVGWKAAWWMGIIIGAVLVPLGWLIQGNAAYFWTMIRVFAVVAVTALFIGLAALLGACWLIDPVAVNEFHRHGNEVIDDVAFARAGSMHNFSYLGGLLGILSGAVTIYRTKHRLAKSNPVDVDSANS